MELPFLASLGVAGAWSLSACPWATWHRVSLFCSSRDPPDGFGAQAAASALCRGPREGLGVGEGRQRQRPAGPVSPSPCPSPNALKGGRGPVSWHGGPCSSRGSWRAHGRGACGRARARWGAFHSVFFFHQPDPVARSQAEPSAQLHECDVDPDPLGDPGEPGMCLAPTSWLDPGRSLAACAGGGRSLQTLARDWSPQRPLGHPPPARPGSGERGLGFSWSVCPRACVSYVGARSG